MIEKDRPQGEVDYLRVPAAAALIGLSPATIRKYLHDGVLPRHKAGRCVLIRRADVLALVTEVK